MITLTHTLHSYGSLYTTSIKHPHGVRIIVWEQARANRTGAIALGHARFLYDLLNKYTFIPEQHDRAIYTLRLLCDIASEKKCDVSFADHIFFKIGV